MSAQGDVARGSADLADASFVVGGAAVAEAAADLGATRAARGYPGGPGRAGPGSAGPAISHADPAGPVAGRGGGSPSGRRSRLSPRAGRAVRKRRPAAGGPSVWQQAWNAWSEAGLSWRRPPEWAPGVLERDHTEPIPVIRDAPAGPGLTAHRPDDAGDDGAAPGAAPDAAPDAGRRPAPAPARRPAPARPAGRRGRRVIAAAGTAAVVLAAAGGFYAWRLAGTAAPSLGTLAGLPTARLADADFAPGPAGAAPGGAAPVLAGVAGSGADVVAFGSAPWVPSAKPLFLFSADGGRTWRVAPVAGASGATPLMAAGSGGKWLALGAGAAWTSADGSSWTAVHGVAPMQAGDRVLALTAADGGFVAVGEHMSATGPGRAPVMWTSPDGLTWQRRAGKRLALAADGRVGALRWAVSRGKVLVVGGDVARTTARRGRKVGAVSYLPGVWRSADGGVRWKPVHVPATHGASRWLGGFAATGRDFVAVRPGRTAAGRPDAVAFVSGTGAAWRFAGKLAGGALRLGGVAGSDNGAVVTGSVGARQVGFVTTNGRRWHPTARLGLAPTSLTAETVGPGGTVVAAGVGASQAAGGAAPSGGSPFLLLAGARAQVVGERALASVTRPYVVVRDLAAAAGREVAVGGAGGGPAIWAARPGGRWSPAGPGPSVAPGAALTGVVHGAAGWLAIGGDPVQAVPAASAAGALAAAPEVALISQDGLAWRSASGGPFAAAGVSLAQAAAGPSGYLVVGAQVRHGKATAAAWWSSDLSAWTPMSGLPAAPGGPASQMLAVAAGKTGFVAVGGVGARPGVWLSADGQTWTAAALALPAGAASAALTKAAVLGSRVVAVGVATPRAGSGAGPVPFAAVSSDGGRTWRESYLPHPGGRATATALTAAPGGFVAAGLSGPAGRQRTVFWWSAGGRGWRLVPAQGPQGARTQEVAALTVVGSTLTGVGYQTSPAGAHPLLWLAPIR